MNRPTYQKSTCAVMGCPSWSRRFPGEWLCAKHWRLVPKTLKATLRRNWRRSPYTMRAHRAGERLWRRAVRLATMAAAGL